MLVQLLNATTVGMHEPRVPLHARRFRGRRGGKGAYSKEEVRIDANCMNDKIHAGVCPGSAELIMHQLH